MNRFFVLLVLSLFGVRSLAVSVQAQEVQGETVEPRVIYYGLETTYAGVAAQANPGDTRYCAQVITQEIVLRGEFDARTDYVLCFNSEKETFPQIDANVRVIREFAPEPILGVSDVNMNTPLHAKLYNFDQISVLLQPSCSGQNRGTLFVNIFYGGSYGDVCTPVPHQIFYPNVNASSVWLEGGSCAALTVYEHFYGIYFQDYINYSAAVVNMSGVYQYSWTPPC